MEDFLTDSKGKQYTKDSLIAGIRKVGFTNDSGDLGGLSLSDNLKSLTGSALDNKNAWISAMETFSNRLGLNKVGQLIILANVMVESGNFKWFYELSKGKGRPYGKPAGPYNKIYYGRGPLQVTWYSNYKDIYEKFFKTNGLSQYDIIKNPDLGLRPDVASYLSIGWLYCTYNGKNAIKAANSNKLTSCRKWINGGLHGLKECKEYAKKLSAEFHIQINLND